VTILSIVGARPNFMKVGPIHDALSALDGIRSIVVHTGQHYSSETSGCRSPPITSGSAGARTLSRPRA